MTDFPWELFGGGTAAALVAALFVWHTKHAAAASQLLAQTFAAASQAQAETFAAAVRDGNNKFSAATLKFAECMDTVTKRCEDTTLVLVREQRQSQVERDAAQAVREKVLIDTLREFHK